ncbi:MAG: bifunctional indole-3-glycerol-phosphate synthase TrpC/phosphoribosylanthranilate isomerase TrpF [Synergistaceae bacterium]|nr:bifunctional indole-3-glycerol-phosphate synthase TrpC/phosphoribosylanthranilate isomerase TrpF [Synergistaceae bacterium]
MLLNPDLNKKNKKNKKNETTAASSVLDAIVERKRADVARRMESAPYSVLRDMAEPTARRFGEALKKPGFRFILECKKASPSEGLIRKNFDIAEIAGVYGKLADAVSVLTDEPYFQGGFEYLRRARDMLNQPILAKDFMTCPYQVCEARVHGADAVLLMLSVLDDAAYRACDHEAKRLSMDALTEVHDEEEMKRAIALNAGIIGINNRNLKTLEVDLGTYSRLADMVPPGKVVVCESGIGSRGDILNIRGRADAFLVGSLLMKAERLDLAARRLIFGGVKICGLTSPEDAVKAYESGASFGGVIFAGESPRRVEEALAKEISAASPMPVAGVFVNESSGEIARIASAVGLSAVQLHGDETNEFIDELRAQLSGGPDGCEIWKAIRVKDEIPAARVHADRVLLDTFDKNARGGTGRSFDWSILEGRDDKQRTILAGGIGVENAFQASTFGCYAIDVNSGVEDSPGRKSYKKIDKLFNNLRGGV